MKAMLSKVAGGPDSLVLEDVPGLAAAAGQVVIQVKACGVNFPDVLVIEDKYQFKPVRPFSPGSEVAGIVSAVGEGVTHVKPGDRVMGSTGASGGMAEELLMDAGKLRIIPDSMPFDEAAAFMTCFGTSYYALKERAQLKPGESLLVLGAAGGVGIAAVELGVAMGAKVIAAASTQAKVDFALAHGASSGVVYPQGPFDKADKKQLADVFKAAVGPNGVDVIYDSAGGDYAEAALRSMAWEGRFMVVGFPAGIPSLPLNLTLLKSCDVRGVFYGAAAVRDPAMNQRLIQELFELYAAGKIRPAISARFALADAANAIKHLAGREALGKVVVTMG